MPTEKSPDVKKFLEDPKFAGDREVFSAFIEHELERRAELASKKAAPENIFDRIFGVGVKKNDDRTLLQRIFDGDK